MDVNAMLGMADLAAEQIVVSIRLNYWQLCDSLDSGCHGTIVYELEMVSNQPCRSF